MGKELNVVEINVEILDSTADQSPTELNELTLSLVGGGAVSVNF
jgi:hypothetical protein